MLTTFLHIADVHLGYQQYESEERYKDFGRAFQRAINEAIDQQVDFVLIAGDLFHKASINPLTLLQAKEPLNKLRKANIPAIAITGNHDSTRYGSRFSWLDYLEAEECLQVLTPFVSGRLALTPANGVQGGYVDIKGVRVIGLPYIGASTAPILAELPQVLQQLPQDDIHFTVLMGHFGLEGEVSNLSGAISHNLVAPLKKWINYLALGHVHKPIERESWIYNPGSLEACGMDERDWYGGWYHVQVNTDSGTHRTKHIRNNRRPFLRIKFEVDRFDHPTKLYDALRAELAEYKKALALGPLKPVVQVWLDGVLAFNRQDLDIRHIEEILIEILDPLKALVHLNVRSTEYEVIIDERLDRAELELGVLTDLVIREQRYRGQAEVWSHLIREVKTMALTESEPADIVEAIARRMALMEAETPVNDERIKTLKARLAQLKTGEEIPHVD